MTKQNEAVFAGIFVGATLDKLCDCAKALDTIMNFSVVPFPEKALRELIVLAQDDVKKEALDPEIVDVLMDMGKICNMIANLPEVKDYHKSAMKLKEKLKIATLQNEPNRKTQS